MAIDMKPIYLYVVPFFPSPDSWRGGFFYDAVKAIMRDGRYDVRVMVAGAGRDYDYDDIKVYRFKPFTLGCSDYFSLFTDFFKKRAFARKLAEMGLCPQNISVCHVHLVERLCFYGAWLKRRNPNCIVLAHHHWNGLYGYVGGRMARCSAVKAIEYVRLCRDYMSVDAHVFCSESCRNGFGKEYVNGEMCDLRADLPFSGFLPVMRYRDSVVCYNGVDATIFNTGGMERRADNVFRIGCVANYIPCKSQITLIKAFARVCTEMPEAELVFIGTGKTREMCQRWAADNGVSERIFFRNEIPHLELEAFYKSLSLYVLPSCLEAFNCSLVEAWACGVPCMATDAISFKEVLPQEEWDRWLFPAKDEKALAEKLLWAYNTRPPRQKLTEDLDIDTITTKYLDRLFKR